MEAGDHPLVQARHVQRMRIESLHGSRLGSVAFWLLHPAEAALCTVHEFSPCMGLALGRWRTGCCIRLGPIFVQCVNYVLAGVSPWVGGVLAAVSG